MNIVICDDEKYIVNKVFQIVDDYLYETGLDYDIYTYASGDEAIESGVSFDIAFLDPPYGKKLIQRSLPALVGVMSENGIIVCEHEKECRLPEEEGDFRIHKTYKYGQICLTVYKRNEVETEDE